MLCVLCKKSNLCKEVSCTNVSSSVKLCFSGSPHLQISSETATVGSGQDPTASKCALLTFILPFRVGGAHGSASISSTLLWVANKSQSSPLDTKILKIVKRRDREPCYDQPFTLSVSSVVCIKKSAGHRGCDKQAATWVPTVVTH